MALSMSSFIHAILLVALCTQSSLASFIPEDEKPNYLNGTVNALESVAEQLLEAKGIATSLPATCPSGTLYTTEEGDLCQSLAAGSNLNFTEFEALNPGLQCQPLAPNTSICLGNGVPTNQTCGFIYTVLPGDTCLRIVRNYLLEEEDFALLNPGIDCGNLVVFNQLCLIPAGQGLPSNMTSANASSIEAPEQELQLPATGLPYASVLEQLTNATVNERQWQILYSGFATNFRQAAYTVDDRFDIFRENVLLLIQSVNNTIALDPDSAPAVGNPIAQNNETSAGNDSTTTLSYETYAGQYGMHPFLALTSAEFLQISQDVPAASNLSAPSPGRKLLQLNSYRQPYSLPASIRFLTANFTWQSNPVGFLYLRRANYVTSVKNQNPCGSCWAFSGIAAVETKQAIESRGLLVDLSEQEMLDCIHSEAKTDPLYTCQGGFVDKVYDHIAQYGVAPLATYPYYANDGAFCKDGNIAPQPYKVREWEELPYNQPGRLPNQYILMQAVNNGPVVAYIDASMEFMHYTGGVIRDFQCNQTINHAVAVVGYYIGDRDVNGRILQRNGWWLIKNSWGTYVGEAGYWRLDMWNERLPLRRGFGSGASGGFDFSRGTCGIYNYGAIPNVPFVAQG